MKKHLILVLAIIVATAGCTKSADDYRVEAMTLQKSNDILGSERMLQEGIQKHPDSEVLPQLLMLLYRESEQWDKVASYVAIAPSFKNDASPKYDAYRDLGTHYFESKDYERAYRFFTEAGEALANPYVIENNRFLEEYCPHEAALAYRNAAGAAGRLGDYSRMRQSVESINTLASESRCAKGEGAAKVRDYSRLVQSWLNDR